MRWINLLELSYDRGRHIAVVMDDCAFRGRVVRMDSAGCDLDTGDDLVHLPFEKIGHVRLIPVPQFWDKQR